MRESALLSKSELFYLLTGFIAVYIAGLFVPLMENDSAQHATMAMRIALTNDFSHIYKGENPYLDKPQLHFWLAAASMKLLGISHFAYRIPAVLCLFLAAFSAKKIADLLFENQNIGNLALLIFLSSQTIILSAHDVRTDAVLTGFIAFAVWQWLRFIKNEKLSAAILAGLGTAFAFSAKGMMAVVIIGFCILSYLLYAREWRRFFKLKLWMSVAAFCVGVLPVLLAYWNQFGVEGLKFILFNQSLNRLNAKGFAETSPDYLFFFHTLLWAFLPFSALFYYGVSARSAAFVKSKFRKVADNEFLTLGGFWLVMLLFSFSKFKLPHYLNGLIPILSVFTASYLYHLFHHKKKKTMRVFLVLQLVVVTASIILIAMLTEYFTGIPNILMYITSTLIFAYILYLSCTSDTVFRKFVLISLWFAVGVNLFLNTQFYPVLTQFQGGLRLAGFVNEKNIDLKKIKMLKGNETWSFDFYTRQNTPRISEDQLEKSSLLVISSEDLAHLRRPHKILRKETDYGITRLSLKFLNPKTRNAQLSGILLVQILN